MSVSSKSFEHLAGQVPPYVRRILAVRNPGSGVDYDRIRWPGSIQDLVVRSGGNSRLSDISVEFLRDPSLSHSGAGHSYLRQYVNAGFAGLPHSPARGFIRISREALLGLVPVFYSDFDFVLGYERAPGPGGERQVLLQYIGFVHPVTHCRLRTDVAGISGSVCEFRFRAPHDLTAWAEGYSLVFNFLGGFRMIPLSRRELDLPGGSRIFPFASSHIYTGFTGFEFLTMNVVLVFEEAASIGRLLMRFSMPGLKEDHRPGSFDWQSIRRSSKGREVPGYG